MATSARSGHFRLTILILVGLVLGAVFGEYLFGIRESSAFGNWISALSFVGRDLFLGLLKMVIVPLIIASIITGIASIGDVRAFGRVGIQTFLYYVLTMIVAVSIGLFLVNAIAPGNAITAEQLADASTSYADYAATVSVQPGSSGNSGPPSDIGGALMSIVRTMIPSNPLAAAADPGIAALPIVFFSILFALFLTTIGERKRVVVSFFEAIFAVMTRMVEVIVLATPIGVFALVAWSVARIGLETFTGGMLGYGLTVVAGLSLHGLIILPLVLYLVIRTNPFRYMWQMRSALMTAFGTDSSSATLPVTLEAAAKEGGVSERTARFVLPLGATINMDGTALFEAVAIVFIAQAYGVDLGLAQMLVIALLATLTAVGAAGIPSASLVMIPVIIGAVNQMAGAGATIIPIEGLGLILGVDRLLDMCRTTVNVWGDAVGAKIIDTGVRKRGDTALPDEVEVSPST